MNHRLKTQQMRKFKNLAQLEIQIGRLESKIQKKESLLNDNFRDFRENFGSYLYETCCDTDKRGNSGWFSKLSASTFFRSVMVEAVNHISEQLSAKLGRWKDRYFTKEEETRQ
jgi:hypothetical protein